MRTVAWIAWTVWAAALPGAAAGGSVVWFQDGRSLAVERVERAGPSVQLFLVGGGALAVPAERIANWAELDRTDDAAASHPRAAGAPTEAVAAWRRTAGPYADLIARTAERHGVDPALLAAMAQVESAFDPGAVSPEGASGLLQLMPDTARRFGVADVFDVAQNVDGAARYLGWLLERFEGRTDLALAGYNAGEGAVDRHRGVPPYRETRQYVRRVLDGATRGGELAP